MRRLLAPALLCVTAGFLFVACSEGGVSTRYDFSTGDGPPATCSPGNCNGCCLGNICVEGNAKSACGVGGLACVECTQGMLCQTGKCVPENTGCSSSNCAQGCCQGDTCRSGVGNDACGKGGGACQDCAASGGVCSAANRTCLSSCTPNCTGKCKGADDGCGGKCQVNDCQGCCIGEQCTAGVADAACGKGGAQCSDCTKQVGSKCGNDQKCSSCTPKCTGKCPGASDECGGTCKNSDCAGCCVGYVCELGTADNACGKGGGACADCAAQGSSCTNNNCGSTCTPDCTGKCPGASDGCGGTCQSNSCNGCCDGITCQPGKSDTACGKSGGQCYVCPTDFQGYKWKCDSSQTCVKDTPTSGADCTGKTGGTTACTNNGKPGKCWDGKCCTGCYDQNFSTPQCWNYINGYSTSCGEGGDVCKDCTATSQICKNYQCATAPAGPCTGKQELDSCVDGGKNGKCIAGSCCTGCYYSDSGSLKCDSTPDDAHCGKDGASCTSCKAYQNCDATAGSCALDPAAKFKLIAEDAYISNNKTWDTIGTAEPDPYMGLTLNASSCSGISVSKCTGKVSNTFQPQWDFDMGTYPVSTLAGTHCAKYFDADGPLACAPPFETMGTCLFDITESDIEQGYKLIWDCPDSGGTDHLVWITLRFQHQP